MQTPKMNIVLQKIKIAGFQKITREFWDNLEFAQGYDADDFIADMFTVRWKSFLLGEDLGDVIISFPANWREAFKDRWFPRWLKKKYPVRFTEYRANQKVIYPELNVPTFPNERQLYSLTIK